MISRIEIENFQSIESLDMECGLITVLVGESDTGKSAVVRALAALAHNDYPANHVTEGAEHSTVAVTVDGVKVEARKGEKVNEYRSHVGELNEEKWVRVGREVPARVSDVLGWHVLELDDGSKFIPSIARQFDPPFLLNESSLRAAKLMGSLTSVSKLYAAIREGSLREQRSRRQASDLEERSDALHEEVAERFQQLGAEKDKLEDLGSRAVAIGKLRVRIDFLRQVLENMDAAAVIREGLKRQRVKAGVDLEPLRETLQRLSELRKLIDGVAGARAKYEAVEALLERSRESLAHTEAEVAAYEGEMAVCPVCGQEVEL